MIRKGTTVPAILPRERGQRLSAALARASGSGEKPISRQTLSRAILAQGDNHMRDHQRYSDARNKICPFREFEDGGRSRSGQRPRTPQTAACTYRIGV